MEYNFKEHFLCSFLVLCKEEEHAYYLHVDDKKIEMDFCREYYNDDENIPYCELNGVRYNDVFYTYEGTDNYYYDYEPALVGLVSVVVLCFCFFMIGSLLRDKSDKKS